MEARTIIETHGLTKRYDEVVAVDHLELSIRQGEVFGLLGPNGAGKTTTTLMLLGLSEPDGGTAFIDGNDCIKNPIAVKRIVGYLPDNVGFYPELSGRENLVLSGELNGLDRPLCEKRASTLLERVGMTYAADRKAGSYSRGMRQRLGIADVLMKAPKLIIMDEPTLGLDPEGTRELMELIGRLSKEDGLTILISSHQLYQIQQVCDRVGIFVKGKLIACGCISELGAQLENEGLYLLDLTVEAADAALCELLRALPGVEAVSCEAGGRLQIKSTGDIRREVTALLVKSNHTLMSLHQRGGDLEEIYHRYFEKAGETDEADPNDQANGNSFQLHTKNRQSALPRFVPKGIGRSPKQ